MGRRRVKKTVKQASKSPWGDLDGVEVKGHHEKQEAQFTDPDGIVLLSTHLLWSSYCLLQHY